MPDFVALATHEEPASGAVFKVQPKDCTVFGYCINGTRKGECIISGKEDLVAWGQDCPITDAISSVGQHATHALFLLSRPGGGLQ
ncbi:hypothetical protein [Arthrobacter oryzae]|uniref:hypothetical protein n=1 Tax=Arthrobacter oryzae TaxID=409290 RepID=UPI002858D0B8|nr:hypothetical protein [Arthrobacter oryzae]MDR6508509.1 hypothetical protein [Arthrobacter oryzae]